MEANSSLASPVTVTGPAEGRPVEGPAIDFVTRSPRADAITRRPGLTRRASLSASTSVPPRYRATDTDTWANDIGARQLGASREP
jgi:hypothetical protein